MNEISQLENSLAISSPYNTGGITITDESISRQWWDVTWSKTTENVHAGGQLYLSDFDLWRAIWRTEEPLPELSDDAKKLQMEYGASDISPGCFIRFNDFIAIPGPTNVQDPYTEWFSIYLSEEVKQAVLSLYSSCRQ